MPVTQSTPGDLLGGAVEIQFGDGKTIGQVLGLDSAVNFIEQVKVNIVMGAIITMDITLDPPIEQAIALLKSKRLGIGFSTKQHQSKTSTPQAAAGQNQSTINNQQSNNLDYSVQINQISIRLHYGGLSSPWFKGLLLQPEVDISIDGISITMKAIGMLFTSQKSLAPVTFQAQQTKQQAINQLLTDEVEVIYEPEAASVLQQPMSTTRQTYTGKSHLEHARAIANTVGCKIIQIGGLSPSGKQQVGVRHVSSWRNNKTPPSATFVAYRQINPSNREFPLISFTCSIQNVMLGPFSGFNIGTGTKKITITDSTESYAQKRGQAVTPKDGTTAGAMAMGQATKQGDTQGMSQPDQAKPMYPSPGSLLDTVTGYCHDFLDKAFEFELTSVGVVDLLPGALVGVAISDITELSSTYDLWEVEHTVSSGGVETKINVKRTGGMASAFSQGIETVKNTVKSKFNSKPPKTSTPTPANAPLVTNS